MATPSVALIVDDESHIRRAVRNSLNEDFDRVLEAASAGEAVDLAAAHRPDVIVLDLGLPDKPGRWVCAEVRKWSSVPIIVLSAHHSENEKIRLLDGGADDYVTKPFHPGELLARVRAQVRRARMADVPGEDATLTIGELVIDAAARTGKRGGEDVHLTPTEWELLRSFLRHAGKTLTHHQLFRSVWAASSGDPRQYLRVYVANLRRPGVPEGVEERIFEPFYHAPASNEQRGTGLGLAIARSVAEAQGGTVRYRGRKDGGSVFELRLPGASLEATL